MYEVELKSLLGSEEKADALKKRMREADPKFKLLAKSEQLNHYFTGGNLRALADSVLKSSFSDEKAAELESLAARAKRFSVRTRQKNDEVLLVVKVSTDEATSVNGTSRYEFEERVDLPLMTLDNILLGSGFEYEAKWSRVREEYALMNTTACLDKSSGYGWVAEFEKMVSKEEDIPQAKKEIEALMGKLGVSELPQERLERMFSFYNAHWQEYYGTNKTFTVA